MHPLRSANTSAAVLNGSGQLRPALASKSAVHKNECGQFLDFFFSSTRTHAPWGAYTWGVRVDGYTKSNRPPLVNCWEKAAPSRAILQLLTGSLSLCGRPNCDGIDVTSSANTVVRGCTVRTGDDAFSPKTWQGFGRPVEERRNRPIAGHFRDSISPPHGVYVRMTRTPQGRACRRARADELANPESTTPQSAVVPTAFLTADQPAHRRTDLLTYTHAPSGCIARADEQAKSELTTTHESLDVFAEGWTNLLVKTASCQRPSRSADACTCMSPCSPT